MPSEPKASKNPVWTEDEHILALDLYLSKKPGQPQKGSREVLELSALLNRLHTKLGTISTSTLRNADGVYMKLMNLKAHDPESLAKGLKGLGRGNHLEEKVWADYGANPQALRQVAGGIRRFIESSAPAAPPVDDEELAPEGRLLFRAHRAYERSLKNRAKKLAGFKAANSGKVFCECCGFDFEATYGARGANFIEVHHQIPVHQLKPGQVLKLADLRLLCSNCHRMIHVRAPMLAVEALRELMTVGIA